MGNMPGAAWSGAKKTGFGWGLPIAWQESAVLAAYLLLIVLLLELAAHWLLVFIPLLTMVFLLICWQKGERNR